MRVIAGTAKGRRLRPPPGGGTRPITDRAKESLFSILGPRIEGQRFLDLFAGTGSVGIEALSRGSAHATFVERAPRAAAIIRQNLEITGLQARAEVVTRDVFAYLRLPPSPSREPPSPLRRPPGLSHEPPSPLREPPLPFNVIFVAPPQWRGLWARAVRALDRGPGWLGPGALVVAQHDPAETATLDLRHLRPAGERSYGRVRFTFFAAP